MPAKPGPGGMPNSQHIKRVGGAMVSFAFILPLSLSYHTLSQKVVQMGMWPLA